MRDAAVHQVPAALRDSTGMRWGVSLLHGRRTVAEGMGEASRAASLGHPSVWPRFRQAALPPAPPRGTFTSDSSGSNGPRYPVLHLTGIAGASGARSADMVA